ncbi:hypothetical protein [Actinoplanes sp. NPDC020271]|uniref:hypothetical protein n=1 Tax=Actinoplanes sp. NPDC020271 TaxID=3363896 RepID=UPI00379A2E23
MIPASFPLILVAVVCLAIGLIRGSSSLLIASIVANLLVAVVLVIGLRQRAAARQHRADAPEPVDPLDDDAVPPGPAPRRTAGAPDAHDSAPAGAAFAADSGSSASFARDRSAAAGRTDPIGFPAADEVYGKDPVTDQGQNDDLSRTGEGARAAGTHQPDESVVSPRAEADYQAASSTIGAARRGEPGDEQAWRRPSEPVSPERAVPEPTSRASAPDPALRESAHEPVSREASSSERASREPAAGSAESFAGSATAGPGASPDSASGTRAGGAAFPVQGSGVDPAGADAVLGDEFGEPDADDPDDEPLPQSVRPTDAVRVARLDTDVLVVDGRPRYHMADCPHLVGRLTESLPAAEAVELGFSPCGLCRPVDRLLGVDARR